MKTLVLNGSPRRGGDTDALVNAMVERLIGEVKVLTCEDGISPCTDCRFCRTRQGCSIDDEMQAVYPYLDACDNVILASPIWFSSLSGSLLNLASRMQTRFSAGHFRKETRAVKKKNGVIVLVGAEKGTETIPLRNALTIMKIMDVRRPCAATVLSMDTDSVPAGQDERALQEAREAAMLLNALHRA